MSKYDCTDNLITARVCGGIEPTSGLYIEDVEGFDVSVLSMLAGEKNITAEKLLSDKLRFAARKVDKKLSALLNANGYAYERRGVDLTPCSFTSGTSISTDQRGLKLSKNRLNTTLGNIYIASVQVKAKTTGTTTLTVKNEYGNTLHTATVSLTADKVTTVALGKAFTDADLYVTVDNTGLVLYETNCSYSYCCGSKARGSDKISIQGWTGDETNNIGYLAICVRLDCSQEGLFCAFVDRLSLAMLYATAAEIAREAALQTRINAAANYDGWGEMAAMWEEQSVQYIETEVLNIARYLEENDKYCCGIRSAFTTARIQPV